jgi:hypothetical protein
MTSPLYVLIMSFVKEPIESLYPIKTYNSVENCVNSPIIHELAQMWKEEGNEPRPAEQVASAYDH